MIRNILYIPQENFKTFDLNKPFILSRTFDVAACLELAEHLEPENACDFIGSLTRLASVILFSATIPLQGGTHHVKEQWPDYWAQKFKARGLVPVDAIGKRIWGSPDKRNKPRHTVYCASRTVFHHSKEPFTNWSVTWQC